MTTMDRKATNYMYSQATRKCHILYIGSIVIICHDYDFVIGNFLTFYHYRNFPTRCCWKVIVNTMHSFIEFIVEQSYNMHVGIQMFIHIIYHNLILSLIECTFIFRWKYNGTCTCMCTLLKCVHVTDFSSHDFRIHRKQVANA